MKTLVITLCALATATEIFAANEKYDPSKDPRNSPEAKAARRERRMKTTGGFLEDYRNYKGQFLYLNSQTLVKPADIEQLTIGTMNQFFRSKFAIVPSEKFEVAKAKELMAKADAQGAVFLIDDPAMPTLFIAPEDNWAAVNVAKLNADKPDADLLNQRTRREMWRALSYTLGCISPADVCVMKPVGSLKDLDDLSANAPSRYPLYDIRERLPKIGIGAIRTTSYKSACEEGWAPAPTNDYQKAIWEKVHSVPKNPMKIEFDPKKGR